MYQLQTHAHAEIEIKKSRFLGQLYPVTSRNEAQALLTRIRAEHPNAVHVCWVLLCEGDSGLDDDGEPSGTAAKPIYNVMVHKDIFNVLAVVVRYWGGTKLGAGGLTRAYGQAISEACKSANLVPIITMCEIKLALAFSEESALRRLCEQNAVLVVEVSYQDKAIFSLSMPSKLGENFKHKLQDFFRGTVQFLSQE
ncbi:MAG: IMPACT family protein [Undibacterium sp.]|nr:IMPACT family protein [Undibacterium sp.]